jgi:hypothetical protein
MTILTSIQLRDNLALVELKPGLKFSVSSLKMILPDIETALFFAKLYELNVSQLARLLATVFDGIGVVQALTQEAGLHSIELQDYVEEIGYEWLIKSGDVTFGTTPPQGEVLPELWRALQVDVAKSVKEVAEKLADVVGELPGKEGQMVFQSLMTVNAKRPILGDYKARVHHAPKRPNLVVLDVSGSMTEETVAQIIEDVVAMSYMADAHLAIVSNTTTHWEPGGYTVDAVLAEAEYGGTRYETLSNLLDRDWGVVVCVADYDSSARAKEAIASKCSGNIELVLDISLVDRPTFLAEVVGQLANEVKPLLVAEPGAGLTDTW